MTARSAIRVALALVFAATLACGTEPERKPPAPILDDPNISKNTTAEGAVKRLVWAYENKRFAELSNLLTEDFTWEFSIWADPTLAQEYANGWFKSDEDSSARHLFQGYQDPIKGYFPAARSIALTLAKTNPVDDTEGKDPTKFKVLATRVDGEVVSPPYGSETTDIHYIVTNNFHRFYLVRGDAAVAPAADQPADSLHWYIYRWVDETAQPVAPAGMDLAAQSTTWGLVMALYR